MLDTITMNTEEIPGNQYLELNKHIMEIEKICRANLIPMLITYVNPVTEVYVNRVITPKNIGIELKNDKISKLNVGLNDDFSIKVNKNDPKDFIGDMFDSVITDFDHINKKGGFNEK